MAIDDNTVYGLTGAQIKELPGKIKAVEGMAKVLTTDDYNYPENDPQYVAMWLLPDGIYKRQDSSVAVRYSTTYSLFNSQLSFIVATVSSSKVALVYQYANGGSVDSVYANLGETKANAGPMYSVLTSQNVVNNLTSSSSSAALSANQGKVLKGLIDAIVVPTKVSDLTNDSGYQTASDVSTAISGKADTASLATVATSGSYNDLSNKPTIPTVPTNVSAFTNDSGYQTASDVSTAISTAISSVMTFKGTVATVADLPSGASVGDVYNVTATGDNYVWDGSVWDKLSGTVDLSNYYTKTETDTALAAKANTSTTYTKTEVDTALGAKANSADVYTKAQVDAAVAGADNVVYIPITITSVQDMTFSTTETSTAIAAMMDAGKKVMYRMSIPVSVAGLAPGVYDFTAQYHWTGDNNAIIIDSVMSGVLGFKCMGIARHSGNIGQIEIYFLQEKLTNDNKLSTFYVDTSGSTGYKFVLVTENDPDSSTVGSVGDVRVCRLTSHAFVCTAVNNGVYTWSQLHKDIPAASQSNSGLMLASDKTKLDNIASGAEVNVQSDWNQTNTAADDFIKNKPTIPTVPTTVSSFTNDAGYQTASDVSTAIAGKADSSSLATVATSGSYADLSNKPTIPTVNNATLTIQKNGTTVQTFTANASSNKTANIEVPVITMTTTDPGEGSALAANNFIAVYS